MTNSVEPREILAFEEVRSYDHLSMQARSKQGTYTIRPNAQGNSFDVRRNGALIGGAESPDDCGLIAQRHSDYIARKRAERKS